MLNPLKNILFISRKISKLINNLTYICVEAVKVLLYQTLAFNNRIGQ